MRRIATTIISAVVCGVALTGCGGGGSKSGLKSNAYLGNLPSIHADYEAKEASVKEKLDKVKNSGNWQKMMEAAAKETKEWAERNAKFEAERKAEWAKIDGKAVPYTASKEFEKLSIKVESVKLCADNSGIVIEVAAKEDFTITHDNMNDYQMLNYRVLAKDGTEIYRTSCFIFYMNFRWTAPFKQGEKFLFSEKTPQGNLSIGSKPEKWVDFASIEFITPEEARTRS